MRRPFILYVLTGLLILTTISVFHLSSSNVTRLSESVHEKLEKHLDTIDFSKWRIDWDLLAYSHGYVPAEDRQVETIKTETNQTNETNKTTSEEVMDDNIKNICSRTMLFTLQGARGFSSEFNRLVRAAAVAEAMGYTVILNQFGWVYGDYTDYFRPQDIHCENTPRKDRIQMSLMDSTGENLPDVNGRPWWTQYDHIQDWASNMTYLDSIFWQYVVPKSASQLNALHRQEITAYPPPLPLSASDTIPTLLYDSFEIEAELARRFMKPNLELQEMIGDLKDGLDSEGGSDIVVGLHVRLGDKCLENSNPKYSPLRFASPQEVKEKRLRTSCPAKATNGTGSAPTEEIAKESSLSNAQAEIYIKAIESQIAQIHKKREREGVESQKAVVWVMSDEEGVIKKLGEIKNVLGDQTGVVLPYEFLDLTSVSQSRPKSLGSAGGSDMEKYLSGTGFSAVRFEKSSLETRVALTRRFLRDLVLLGQETHSIVFTASSNVGRLMVLLGGLEGAISENFVSCDTRWYPTAYYT